MLKLKYLFENFELVKYCLTQYDYDKDTVDEMIKYFRISSNAIYPFRCEGRIQFLRLAPVEEKSFAEVSSEIHLINWLREKKYPAMKPVTNKNGNDAEQVNTKWGCYIVSCFEQVPGETLEDVEGTLSLVSGYGKLLGSFHQWMKEYPYSEERIDHLAQLEVMNKRLVEFNAPAVVLKEYQKVCEELSSLEINKDTYGLVHYDFEPDNVLYDKETGSYGVIDFDDAIRCWYSLDVVRAMDALDDVVEEEQVAEAENSFFQGYQSVCPFSEKQRNELPLMRRFVHLQEYATLLYVMSEQVPERPEWMIQLEQKLKYKMGMLEESMRP